MSSASADGGGGGGEVIDEEGIYLFPDADAATNADNSAGGTASRTPTDSSRRSSQLSLPASEAADSTVPKQQQPPPPPRNGVRHLVEKRREKTVRPDAPVANERASATSIFTLDHVRKIFGAQQSQDSGDLQRRLVMQQQRRRSSGAAAAAEDVMELRQRLSRLSVDSLPAVFLAKSLGDCPADGLFGVDCVRRPVEALVKAAGKRKSKTRRPLPIAQVTVTPQGISVRPHPQSDGGQVARGFHAIDSVSYAVVDPGVQRIFCLVTAPPTTSAATSAAAAATVGGPICHAFLCNSPDTAHRLVLAVTLAFELGASVSSAGSGFEHA